MSKSLKSEFKLTKIEIELGTYSIDKELRPRQACIITYACLSFRCLLTYIIHWRRQSIYCKLKYFALILLFVCLN